MMTVKILKYGGTITHHHAVGKDHSAHYQKQEESFQRVLKAVKSNVDPHWIMNPGTLINTQRSKL
jgi:alkyldihydroxyacetonephosphate synthase